MATNELYIECNVSNDISSIVKGDIKMEPYYSITMPADTVTIAKVRDKIDVTEDQVRFVLTIAGNTYNVIEATVNASDDMEITWIFSTYDGMLITIVTKHWGDNEV